VCNEAYQKAIDSKCSDNGKSPMLFAVYTCPRSTLCWLCDDNCHLSSHRTYYECS